MPATIAALIVVLFARRLIKPKLLFAFAQFPDKIVMESATSEAGTVVVVFVVPT